MEVIARAVGTIAVKPDFRFLSQLSPETRQEACNNLLKTVVAHHRILYKLGIKAHSSSFLRLIDIHNMQGTLETYPDLSQQIYEYMILHGPVKNKNFYHDYAEKARQAIYNKAPFTFDKHTAEKLDEEYQILLADRHINNLITTHQIGQVVEAPGEGAARILRKSELGLAIERHLKLAAHAFISDDETLSDVTHIKRLWGFWQPQKVELISEKLVGKFNGTISNLRFVALPADREYFDRYIKYHQEDVDVDNSVRFAIAVDLKSSGRPALSNLIDVVMYKRNGQLGPTVILSVRGRSKGEDAIEYLHLQSVLHGRVLEANALRHAFSAGAGSLGKRR